MDNLYNIENYLKAFVGIVGLIAALKRLQESFASIKRKQELKLDLEILEKLKANNSFDSSKIENKIKKQLDKAFENRTENLTNFFVGIATFVGFGFWTVDILQNSKQFNAWIILTLLCSLAGLNLFFEDEIENDKKGIFYQIGFYDKATFRISIVIALLSGILTGILMWKINGFSYWYFLTGLLCLISVINLFKSTRQIKE